MKARNQKVRGRMRKKSEYWHMKERGVGVVHEDIAANQVHAEEGGDVLDSDDAESGPMSLNELSSTSASVVVATNAAAIDKSFALDQSGATFSCEERDEG